MAFLFRNRNQIKHKYLFHVTFNHLVTDKPVSLPDSLIVSWSEKSKKQYGDSKPAVISDTRAIWEETADIRITFVQEQDASPYSSRLLSVTLKEKPANSRKYTPCSMPFDIELEKFASIDGKETKEYPVTLTLGGVLIHAKITITIKTLWIRDYGKKARSFNRLSVRSSKSNNTQETHSERNTMTPTTGSLNLDGEWAIGENPHQDPERGTQILVTLGGRVTTNDILFLLQRIPAKERSHLLKKIIKEGEKEAKRGRLMHSTSKPLPFDLLYSVMNLEDISDDFFQIDLASIEFYLSQFCSLLVFYRSDFPKLESFLLGSCSKSSEFALKLYLQFKAISGVKKVMETDSLKEIVEQLCSKIEEAVGEGHSTKATGFHDELVFIDSLMNIGYEIMKMDPATRLTPVREMIGKLNKTDEQGHPHIEENQVFLPYFTTGKNPHHIMNIVANESIIFGTANRAPFMIFVEFISSLVEKQEQTDTKHHHPHLHAAGAFISSHLESHSSTKQKEKKSKKSRKEEIKKTEKKEHKKKDKSTKKLRARRHTISVVVSPPDEISQNNTQPTAEQNQDVKEANPTLDTKSDQGTGSTISTVATRGTDHGEPELDKFYEEPLQTEQIQHVDTPKILTTSRDSVTIKHIKEDMATVGDDTEHKHHHLFHKHHHHHSSVAQITAEKVFPFDSNTSSTNTLSIRNAIQQRMLWKLKEERIKSQSPFGNLPGWGLTSVIVKVEDDLRQESFALQLVAQFQRIFNEFELPLRLRPYKVLATSANCGFIETVTNAITLDAAKRLIGPNSTLLDFFRLMWGNEKKDAFKKARQNFVESMAAYSLVCYILQVKDRHGGNIMIDQEGHVIHIDYGFLLDKKQIRLLNTAFEKAPFKLTPEFVEVMGGKDSSSYKTYKELMKKGYRKLRKRHYLIQMLVDIVQSTTKLPCLTNGTVDEMESRFNLFMNKKQCDSLISSLIKQALSSYSTKTYDYFNYKRFGIRG